MLRSESRQALMQYSREVHEAMWCMLRVALLSVVQLQLVGSGNYSKWRVFADEMLILQAFRAGSGLLVPGLAC